MGGAQPLAATFAGAVSLNGRMPADQHRLPAAHPLPRQAGEGHRRSAGHDQASAVEKREAVSHRPARQCRRRCCRNWCSRAQAGGIKPDLVTDQTSAHDLINGYLPSGLDGRSNGSAAQAGCRASMRASKQAAAASCATHVRAILDFKAMGMPRRSTTATTSARWRKTKASKNAFDFPGLRAGLYSSPVSARASGPFRWVALSGDPEDIYKTDARIKELFPHQHAGAPLARHGRASASPSRACRRASAGSVWASATSPAWPSTKW